MEDIAFSDWPGQPADLNTGSNPWLPAYGFQTPSALLEKEDFIGNPDAEYFLQNSIGYMYLETIQEETSDDLRSESDLESRGSPIGWFETDSETGSVIRTNGTEEPDGDLGELACPAKRRKQETITLLSVVSFDGEESLSRSSSLLQFETLEQQCLEPATSTPSIFSFDHFESRKSNVSPDSLDTDWEKENDYYKSLNIDVPRRKDKTSSRDSLLYNNSEGSDTSEGTLEPSRSFDNLKTWKSFDSLPLGNPNKALVKEKLSTENLSEDSGYSDHFINNKSSSGGNLAKQVESAMKPIDSSVNNHFRKKRSCDGFGAYDGEVFHHISGNFGVSYQDLSAFEKYEPCDEYRSPLITRFIKNKMHRRQTVLATPKTLNIDQDRAKLRPASASEPNLNQAVSENLVDCASVPRDLNLVGESSGGSVAAKNWDLTDLSVGDETVLVKCDDDMAKVKREGSYDMAMTNRVDLTDDEDSFCYTRKLPKTAIVEFDKKVLKAISEQSIQSIMASSGNLTETYLNEIYDVAKSTPNLVMNENELIDRYLEEERRKSTLDVRRKNSIIKSSTSTSGMSDLEDKTLTSCGSVASRGVHFSPVVSEVNWRDDDSVSTATPERESSVYSFESTPERDLVQRKPKLSTLAQRQRLSVSQPELSDTENCKRDFVDSLKSLRQDLSKSQPDFNRLRRKGSQLIKKDEHGALVQAYVDRDGIQYKHTHLDLGVFQNSSAPTITAPHHQNTERGPQTAASRTTLSHANDMEAQHAQPGKEKSASSRAKLGGFFSRLASFRFSNRKGQQEKSKLKKKQDAPKPQGIQMPHQRIATKDDYIYIPLKGAAPENNNGPLLKQQQQQHAGGGGVSFAGKPPLPKQPPPTRQAPPRVVHASVKRDVATPPDVSAEKPRRRRRTTIDCVPPPPRMEEQPMGLIETDLDTEVTVITSGCGNAKTRSLLDLGLGASKGAAAEGKRGLRAPEEAARPHKSMEFLLDKQNLKVVEPPENELQKGEGRVMSEHQLRFQRSLQKLTVPEWCKQSQLPREGFLLNKHARHRESRWTGTGSHTNSLTNLGHQHQQNPTQPQSPASHFVRWSTSRLNSTASSPCASTRSSFNSRQPNGSISPSSVRSSFSYRQPYMGWRSQERIAHPKTPHERLANSFIVQTSQQGSPELQNSIKEVTSAIVHYMSHLEGQEFHSQRSSSVSPRGSQKMCWLESSFVGVKPVDSPQTPLTLSESQSTTPVPQSNLQLDLQSQNDLTRNSGRLSPSSTTLEDVLDSLLGLPSAGGSGRAPSPSLQGTVSANTSPCRLSTLTDHTDQFRRRSEGSEPGSSLSTGGATNRKVSLNTSPVLKCRFSHCGRTALANSEEAAFFKSCHNCSFMYCSRTCRRAHWEKHRRNCLFSRIGSLCRQVIAACKEQKDTLLHLSTIARRGYLSHGLGAVKCFFACPELAEKFLFRGYQNLGELTYVRWQDLLPSEMGGSLYAELVQMCRNYNPDTRLVLYVSVCAISETPATGAVKWERQLVSRCGRLKLSKNIPIPEKEQETLETLILTSPKIRGNPETIRITRDTCVNNLQLHLLERGVNLKQQHPDIYRQLKVYSEGAVKFIPVNVYPVDLLTGKSFMCIIMLEADSDSLNKIKTAGVQVKTIDVLSTPLPG